jgi:hypothetical protein
MNRHIKKFSDKLYENIGRGSVLLIKGRPTENGRRLYATTINGYSEVRPGVVMTFLGDQVYQVVRKDGKYYGVKVDYQGEDGLKGVLNLKNPGRPSIVLNHNKTPYHWMTLKHLDIGSALRELGDRLYDHELILEAYAPPPALPPVDEMILIEFFKTIIGKQGAVLINSVMLNEDPNSNPNDYTSDRIATEEEDQGHLYCTDFEWTISYDISINGDALDPKQIEAVSRLYEDETGRPGEDFIKYTGFIKMMGVEYDKTPSRFTVDINFVTNADAYFTFTRGGYMEPDEVEHVNSDIRNDISYVYYGGGNEVPLTKNSIIMQYIDDVRNLIIDKEIPDIYGSIIGKNHITNIDNL